MWYRLIIPTWRFFDRVGGHPELWICKNGHWEPRLTRPKRQLLSLLFNPQGNSYHACNNLLSRLLEEARPGVEVTSLVSYKLVRDLAGCEIFKIRVDGQDALLSGEPSP